VVFCQLEFKRHLILAMTGLIRRCSSKPEDVCGQRWDFF
jgi:hypothetical protein